VDNVKSNPFLAAGQNEAWCLEWKKDLRSSGDLHKDVKWFSSEKNDKWKPLNYFFSIRKQLQKDDPDLTFREIQAVVWVLAGEMGIAPEFNVLSLPVDQLPARLRSNGEVNFSREKVSAIATTVLRKAPDASVPFSGVIAQTAEDQQDIFVPDDEFALDENGVTVVCTDASLSETGFVNGVVYEAVDNALLAVRRDQGADLTTLCTTLVTDMVDLFNGMADFNQDIGSWDVSNVTDMEAMFRDAVSFNQDIGSWNTTNVTSFYWMFSGASAFNQPIGDWNTENVTLMARMFFNAKVFNEPIGEWNTSSVTNMANMFIQAAAFNKPLASWTTSEVTTMKRMFDGAKAFDQPLNSWDVSKVTNMDSMLGGTESFNQDLTGWCVEGIASQPGGFADGSALTPGNLPNWGVSCDPI